MKKATIEYIKYELYESHAVVSGFDQRKATQSSIRIPVKVYYEGKYYPVTGFCSSMDGLLKTSTLILPNTITGIGLQAVDLTECAGQTFTQNELKLIIYEAREGDALPKKKGFFARLFGK